MKTTTVKTTKKSVFRTLTNTLLATFFGAAIAVPAHSSTGGLTPITMCAFMMMGEGGPEHQALLDYKAAALNWGVNLTLKSYMNERVVAEEFRAGVCDIANVTDIQVRNFNTFIGTLGAPAAIPTYNHLKMILETLARPNAGRFMRSGDYEIIGVQPAGAVFLFTNDRKIESLSDLAGKRMAVLDGMPEMRQLVVDLGMTPVSSTLTNVFQRFNNRSIDIAAGPALVYDIMELHKGLEPNGGILSEPLVQAHVHFVGRWSKLPENFAQKSREFFIANFDNSLALIRQAEENIPKKWWISLPENRRDEYDSLTRQIRLNFREREIYDATMLTLLRRIRCNVQSTLAECTDANAE